VATPAERAGVIQSNGLQRLTSIKAISDTKGCSGEVTNRATPGEWFKLAEILNRYILPTASATGTATGARLLEWGFRHL